MFRKLHSTDTYLTELYTSTKLVMGKLKDILLEVIGMNIGRGILFSPSMAPLVTEKRRKFIKQAEIFILCGPPRSAKFLFVLKTLNSALTVRVTTERCATTVRCEHALWARIRGCSPSSH